MNGEDRPIKGLGFGCKAVVVGGSAGGFEALEFIVAGLPLDFSLAILVVQHLHACDRGAFASHLARVTRLPVIEPCDKEGICPGHIYVAPANYHLLVENDHTLALSIDEKVNWSRPSIDVLFESAARVWRSSLIAVILSGASVDGAWGLRAVKMAGGYTLAQDPASAQTRIMPQAAIDLGVVDQVLYPREIGQRLIELGGISMQEKRNFWEK